MINNPLLIWNRSLARLEPEKIYGDGTVRFLYGNALGRSIAAFLAESPWISRLYGWYQDSPFSRKKIAPFIQKFQIPMDEYEARDYRSFNDFFTRRFRPGIRKFADAPTTMPAFCEARYLGYKSLSEYSSVSVKGALLYTNELLRRNSWIKIFLGGPALVARLCPVDYHRFHFPDTGEILDSYRLRGKLYSVNPLALAAKPDILFTNERQVSILETRNFGKLAYIEVGATCVGKIVQTHNARNFTRGEEKGCFRFGASTVVLLGERDRWCPSADILEQSQNSRETFLRLGEVVAESV